MVCNFSKLFWQLSIDQQCSGCVTKLVDLDKNVDSLLQSKHCRGSKDPPITAVMLILNRISPCTISPDVLGALDICNHHVEKFTSRSSFFKKATCEVKDCTKKFTRRVNLTTSSQIFAEWNQHVPVGSGICETHRKSLEAICKNKPEASGEAESLNKTIPESGTAERNAAQEIKDSPSGMATHRPKRKLLETTELNVKLVKTVSLQSEPEECDSLDPDSIPLSQISNFSDSGDVEVQREMRKIEFEKKLSKLNVLQSSLETVLGAPFEFGKSGLLDQNTSHSRLLSNANILTLVVTELAQLLVLDRDPTVKHKLLEITSQQLVGEVDIEKVAFEEAVLDSLKTYYKILVGDPSRTATVARKIVLESLAGPKVSENNLLSHLVESIGASKRLVWQSAKNRNTFENDQCLVPFADRLQRKSPEGHFIPMEWKLKAIGLYESEDSSDVLKGHNNVFKEKLKSAGGSVQGFMLRHKRVLKVSFSKLLALANSDINWPFGLRSLMQLRPSWVLLPSARYLLGCLYEVCHNLTLQLRALNNFISHARKCSDLQIAAVQNVSTIPSKSSLIELLLHPKEEGKSLHNMACFNQSCDKTEQNCGKSKFEELFDPLRQKQSNSRIELFQHLKISYVKSDGKKASKYELTKLDVSLCDLLSKMEERLFDGRESFLQHTLKKELGRIARQNLRKNLEDGDIIIYSDYSKEYALIQPETLKNEGFGASKKTSQIVPQVGEMTVLPPSLPQNVAFDGDTLSFTSPKYLGGSNIQRYEVDVQDPKTSIWYLFIEIQVCHLSSEPLLPKKIFGDLGGELTLKVYGINLAGRGEGAELKVYLSGNASFKSDKYVEIQEAHFLRHYATFWEEHIHISDHDDAPKDWTSILACNIKTLNDIKQKHNRNFNRCFPFTDTGGENWGTQPLSLHSWSLQDLGVYSVWCPTPANHSGVSSYKQAFSLGVPYKLMVRERLCCCLSCLEKKYEDCTYREYVDPPVLITFKKENSSHSYLDSNPQPQDEPPSNLYQIGAVFVIIDSTNENGFRLGLCLAIHDDLACVKYLEEYSGENEEEKFFKETNEVGQAQEESVHTVVITAYVVDSTEKIYSVAACELEDVYNSLNY